MGKNKIDKELRDMTNEFLSDSFSGIFQPVDCLECGAKKSCEMSAGFVGNGISTKYKPCSNCGHVYSFDEYKQKFFKDEKENI